MASKVAPTYRCRRLREVDRKMQPYQQEVMSLDSEELLTLQAVYPTPTSSV